MAEELLKAGLYFDDFRKLRVLEPEMAEKTNDLKDQCKDFVECKFHINYPAKISVFLYLFVLIFT